VATLSRLEWKALAAPWQACIEEAWTSYREGSVPIGAAILDAEGRLAATGRNHRAGGGFEGSEPHGQRLAHAELTALFQATAAHTDLRGFSLYSTMEPCPLCTGALAMARVGVVHFAARDAAFDRRPGSRRPRGAAGPRCAGAHGVNGRGPSPALSAFRGR
jgi:tRNA(Arg) A34 adenosine deaminase TadA